MANSGRRVFNAVGPGIAWLILYGLYMRRPRLPTPDSFKTMLSGAISCSTPRLNCSAYEGRNAGEIEDWAPVGLSANAKLTVGRAGNPWLTVVPGAISPGETLLVRPNGIFLARRIFNASLPDAL